MVGLVSSQPENLCYDPESTLTVPPLMFLFTVCMEGDMHTHHVDQLCTYSGQLTTPNILSNVLGTVHILRHQKFGVFGPSPLVINSSHFKVFYYVKVSLVINWLPPPLIIFEGSLIAMI